jgi:predicted nucleotidyltransferase
VSEHRVSRLRDLVESRRDEIKAIVARHHGHSVAVFGSAARGDDGPASDIDFLVELEPDARPFEILVIGAELEAALGVPVDVGTRDSLRPRVRSNVLAEAIPL